MKFSLLVFCLFILVFRVNAQKKADFYSIQNYIEISLFIDSCINPNTGNKISFKIKNLSTEKIVVPSISLKYIAMLFDSYGKLVNRRSIIEEEKGNEEDLFLNGGDSVVFSEIVPFFRQFEFKQNELYYYLPMYQNYSRKRINGIPVLWGFIPAEPLVFKICNCKN